MKKNSSLKLALAIIGGIVVIGAAVAAIIHFWEDIKKFLPCCKCDEKHEKLEEFDDFEI